MHFSCRNDISYKIDNTLWMASGILVGMRVAYAMLPHVLIDKVDIIFIMLFHGSIHRLMVSVPFWSVNGLYRVIVAHKRAFL